MHDRDLSYRQIGRQMIGRQIYRQIKINRQNCCLFVYGVLKMSSRTNWRKTEVIKKKKKTQKCQRNSKAETMSMFHNSQKRGGQEVPDFSQCFLCTKQSCIQLNIMLKLSFFLSQITKRTFDQLIKEDVFTHYITAINTEGS